MWYVWTNKTHKQQKNTLSCSWIKPDSIIPFADDSESESEVIRRSTGIRSRRSSGDNIRDNTISQQQQSRPFVPHITTYNMDRQNDNRNNYRQQRQQLQEILLFIVLIVKILRLVNVLWYYGTMQWEYHCHRLSNWCKYVSCSEHGTDLDVNRWILNQSNKSTGISLRNIVVS